MVTALKHTICRACHAQCAITLEMRDGQPGPIHGDKNNPAFHGYSCVKGREFAACHAAPARLLHSQKRQPDGRYADISGAQMTAEIADRLGGIIARHGPRAVALYIGTYGYTNAATFAFSHALMEALGSPMLFTSVTIDQPGKAIAMSLHGLWLAGTPPMAQWDVLTLIGTNPLLSMNGGLGANPAWRLHEAKKRGMKLVVIDPRRTECAEKADVHLAVKPGEDPAVLAAIAHVLIAENLCDQPFLQAESVGFAPLKDAVARFTPEFAAARAGVDPRDIVTAARMIGQARQGAFSAGTGSNMAGHGNLVEYFVKALTTLRGFWKRAGDGVNNPGVFINPLPALAATPGPGPVSFGEPMRARNLSATAAGLPTAALADEILLGGEGQVRALFVMGGNPVLAWPDQIKATQAIDRLELLVCFDPMMSATARRAHYVVAPKMPLEINSCTAASETFGNFGPGWGYEDPYGQWSDPVLDVPPGSELVEDWQVLHGISARLGKTLHIKPCTLLDPAQANAAATPLAPDERPTTMDVWRMLLKESPVDFELLKTATQGRIFERPETKVGPRPEDWSGRLDIGAAPMLEELRGIAFRAEEPTTEFPLRLISRRLHDVMNSCWHDNATLRRRARTNHAFMHPQDIQRLQLQPDEIIEISSAHAVIRAVVAAAPDVRQGCVSMSHNWGSAPDEPDDPLGWGGNTGRLACTETGYDRYTGIPLMSAIPVRIAKIN